MNTTAKADGRLFFATLIGALFGTLCIFAGAPYWSIPVSFGTFCAAAWLLMKV